MRFGGRVALAMVLASLLPLSALAWMLRVQLGDRVIAERERRADDAAEAAARELGLLHERIGERLAGLARTAAEDNSFRSAVITGQGDDRRYILGYAERVLPLTGLSVLQIQDERGRILSSGHFRQEYDRIDADVPRMLARSYGPALARVRTPDGSMIALVRADSLRLGERVLYLVGGVLMDESALRTLIAGSELVASLSTPDTVIDTRPGPATLLRETTLPYLAAGEQATAAIRIARRDDLLAELRGSVDRLFLMVAGGALALAILLGIWLANRVSRPVTELADRAAALDLDRLETDFRTDRDDEIGDLSRTLGAMTSRLRSSVRRMREAERRATQGEMARQVNHDIKNGLVPIRNVLRHMAEVTRENPEDLPRIFAERKRTLASSVEYLEELARNYARLAPRTDLASVDAAPVVQDIVRAAREGSDAELITDLPHSLPPVHADSVQLRRILENVIGNALDSLDGGAGRVSVGAEAARGRNGGTVVRLIVADTGRGMTETELASAFEDFHTTKAGGTGLGLSVVRRLVADLAGSLRVDTKPGEGTRVIVELPAVDEASTEASSYGPTATRAAEGARK